MALATRPRELTTRDYRLTTGDSLRRHPHRVIAEVHVDRRAGHGPCQRAREERRRLTDVAGIQMRGDRGVCRTVLYHALDDPDRACRARRERPRRDRVDAHTPLAASLVSERARVALERCFR